MKEYTYGADMGSVKIMCEEMSCFFSNGVGDGEYMAIIWEEKDKRTINDKLFKDFEFIGHFTARGNCFLMAYDCSKFDEAEKQHLFSKGRWFVHLDKKNAVLHFVKCDEDLHA